MTEFVRVRSASGPKHVFDAPLSAVEAWPDDYVVVDGVPVVLPRPVEYVDSAKKRTLKPSVGEPSEGDTNGS